MNNISNQQEQQKNIGFYQRVCEKHEYITVTQTTSTEKEGKTIVNKSTSWLQCKHCGQGIYNISL